MARIGYKVAKYNQIVGDAYKEVASKVPVFAKVVDEKFEPDFNSAELYANDTLAESDYSFKKGSLTFTVDDDADKLVAELLGNKAVMETQEYVSNIDDVASEFGFGHIVKKKVNNAIKYKVEFFPRVKFTKVSTENKSKGESVEFGTTTIEGIVYALDKEVNGNKIGDWEKHQTFDELQEAETYLDKCLTPPAPAKLNAETPKSK